MFFISGYITPGSLEPGKKTLYTIVWITVTLHIITCIWPFIQGSGFEVTAQYRMVWWSMFYLTLLCSIYIMIDTLRRYVNRDGKILVELNQNSYGGYTVHVIIIGIFSILLLHIDISSLLKYPLLFVLTYPVCNALV